MGKSIAMEMHDMHNKGLTKPNAPLYANGHCLYERSVQVIFKYRFSATPLSSKIKLF